MATINFRMGHFLCVFAPTPIVSSVYSLFLWIFVFSTPQTIRKTIAVNFKECVGEKYENINSMVQKSTFVVKARPLIKNIFWVIFGFQMHKKLIAGKIGDKKYPNNPPYCRMHQDSNKYCIVL